MPPSSPPLTNVCRRYLMIVHPCSCSSVLQRVLAVDLVANEEADSNIILSAAASWNEQARQVRSEHQVTVCSRAARERSRAASHRARCTHYGSALMIPRPA